MTVSDIYLVTKSELVEIKDYNTTYFMGSCDSIPTKYMHRIVAQLTHDTVSLKLYII